MPDFCSVRFFNQNTIIMKTAFLNFFFLFFIASTLTAQTSLVGAWVCPLDQSQGYDNETIIFTEDGYYYSTLSYLNGAEYGIGPDIYLGVYEFDGSTLSIYDVKNDTRKSFPISALNGSGFQLYNKEVDQHFQYHYTGKGVLDQTQRATLLSWENYRKLGGAWKSSASILKIIPSLGIAIVRVPDNPDFFRWGHYVVDGNKLTLKEISAEEAVFYTGTITSCNRDGLTLLNDGETERFRSQGELKLDETEIMMVQQYMNMNHRLNMTAIDMIDGRQDFIWKRVDEYGNERY